MAKIHIPRRYWVSDADIQLLVLKDFLELMGGQLQDAKHIEKLIKRYELEAHPDMDEGDRAALEQTHYAQYERDFPQLLHRAFVVMLYSTLESQTLSILQATSQDRSSLSPPPGFNMEKAKTLLKKEDINIIQFTSWKLVDNLIKVRNCVVHANGEPSRTRKDEDFLIALAAEQKSGIDLHGRVLMVRKLFCLSSHETVEQYFDELYAALGY